MRLILLPLSLTNSLKTAADSAILKVLNHGGARTPRPSGEVTAVRTMTLDGFDEIADRWSPILKYAGFRIDLRTVFCHSRPQVTFTPVPHPNYSGGTKPRRCELADLLIVIDHVDPSRRINDRQAVLVQAKILEGRAVKPSGSEWVQHELLAWLPAFSFLDPGYDSRSRDLKGGHKVGSPIQSAEYGGINLNTSPPIWRHELTSITAPWFTSPIPLADFLARMATGQTDCGRLAVRGGSDDWSFTVDELLRVTAAHPIVQTNASVLRGNNNVVGFIADTSPWSSGGGGGWSEYIDGDVPDWPEGPISTIHMHISSIDDRSYE